MIFEYQLAYALVGTFLVLGLLMICVPRPRKTGFFSEEEVALQKRERTKIKSQEKARRVSNKATKKALKAKQKRKAKREKKA